MSNKPDKSLESFNNYGSGCYWWEDSDNPSHPFEQPVTLGYQECYGSYLSGLPEINDVRLTQSYSYLNEFAKWAIENKVCIKCRFPWADYKECKCGKYIGNKDRIDGAEKAALTILDFDREHILGLARQMEMDLQGDSEYARLNAKAREIFSARINRCEKDQKSIFNKKTWKNYLKIISNWFRPSYWIWKFQIIKGKKVKVIPISIATEEILKDYSTSSGICYVKTKGGCVVAMPKSSIDTLKDGYKGATISKPLIKE